MRGTHKLVLRSFLLGAVVGTMHQANASAPICYIPGAGGGSKDAFEVFPKVLAGRGVEFVTFDIGHVGTVVERAHKLVRLLEQKLESNPNFECHFFTFSMGGLVSRYLYHHLDLRLNKDGDKIPGRNVMLSLSTFSSPHRGTPLADWLIRYSPRHTAGMDDLSEDNVKKYNLPEHVNTYSPPPTDIPVYSFLTYINDAKESNTFLGRFGFKVIWETYSDRKQEARSDGIVPLISQALGQVLMTVKAPHGFFSEDVGMRPWAPDVFEAHYRMLTNSNVGNLLDDARFDSIR